MALTLAQIESRVDTAGRHPWWSFLWRHPLLVIGGVLLVIMALVALAAPWMAPYSPIDMNVMQRLKAPSAVHLFGTDAMGRDVFSRVLWGGRVSLIVGISVSLLATSIGVLIGMVAGFSRMADALVMRLMDGMMAIPGIGRLTVDSVLRHDYPVIQGIVLVVAAVYVFINLAIDLLYTVLDPRIRY